MHTLAPKIGTASVFIENLSIRGDEDCWERLPNEARGAEIDAEGQERG